MSVIVNLYHEEASAYKGVSLYGGGGSVLVSVPQQ